MDLSHNAWVLFVFRAKAKYTDEYCTVSSPVSLAVLVQNAHVSYCDTV